MGGIGIGRLWHWSAKNTTDQYRSIDVRRWRRDGLLTAGRRFSWQWSIEGEQVASIVVQAEQGQVRLTRHIENIIDFGETTRALKLYLATYKP